MTSIHPKYLKAIKQQDVEIIFYMTDYDAAIKYSWMNNLKIRCLNNSK